MLGEGRSFEAGLPDGDGRQGAAVSVHGDGDFFNTHTDNGLPEIAHRGCDELWLNPGTESAQVVDEAERLGLLGDAARIALIQFAGGRLDDVAEDGDPRMVLR